MQIMSRKDAIAAGVGQYFTGKPCRNGHISNRYTQSGTCATCVAAAASKARGLTHSGVVVPREHREAERLEKMAAMIEAKRSKDLALAQLTNVAIPIYPQDIAAMFETAIGMCLAAYPVLERADVQPVAVPRRGTPLYTVKVPVEHAPLMHSIANELWYAKGPDLTRVHDRVARQMEQEADDQVEEPPENYK